MASSLPLSLLRPTDASGLVSGRSMPILIVFPAGHYRNTRQAPKQYAKAATEGVKGRINIPGVSGHRAVP
jgi:hypothetical protein